MRAMSGHPLMHAAILATLVVMPLMPISASPPASGPIVAFGDSYTSGWGQSPGHDYPARLALSLQRPVINAGQPGDTTEDGLARMPGDVLVHHPTIVIIEFGANDALQNRSMAAAVANIEAMVVMAREHGIQVVLVGVQQAPYDEAFDAQLQEVARRHQAHFVPDVMREVHQDPALRTDDIHPNDAGADVVARRIEPAVRAGLAGIQPPAY